MKNVNLTFNFIGVCVVDWHSAFKFFSETLGLKYQLEPKFGDWAMLGGGWDAYYHAGSRSAIFELACIEVPALETGKSIFMERRFNSFQSAQ